MSDPEDTSEMRLVFVLGLTALWDSISVYIGPSPSEREKEQRNERARAKMSKQPLTGPTLKDITSQTD